MAYRRIEPEVIDEIKELLRTTDLSCSQIATRTRVSRGVVDRLHSQGIIGKQRIPMKLYRRCGCGAMSRPIGKNACLACEIRRRQRQGTPAEDVSLDTDLDPEHQVRYEKMRILAEARFKAGAKKSASGA